MEGSDADPHVSPHRIHPRRGAPAPTLHVFAAAGLLGRARRRARLRWPRRLRARSRGASAHLDHPRRGAGPPRPRGPTARRARLSPGPAPGAAQPLCRPEHRRLLPRGWLVPTDVWRRLDRADKHPRVRARRSAGPAVRRGRLCRRAAGHGRSRVGARALLPPEGRLTPVRSSPQSVASARSQIRHSPQLCTLRAHRDSPGGTRACAGPHIKCQIVSSPT
jgi:hypothetical protein